MEKNYKNFSVILKRKYTVNQSPFYHGRLSFQLRCLLTTGILPLKESCHAKQRDPYKININYTC